VCPSSGCHQVGWPRCVWSAGRGDREQGVNHEAADVDRGDVIGREIEFDVHRAPFTYS
jgi:hypothetical protein